MLQIAVCDDDNSIVKRITEFISSFEIQNSINLSVFKFNDGNEFLDSSRKFDLIFLDIEMNSSNGIDIAEKIREKDINLLIVYVTGYPDYWKRAYKVHAFDFISKPFGYADIEHVLRDFILLQKESSELPISFITEEGVTVLNMNDIMYFMLVSKRYVEITTVYKKYHVKESLNQVTERLGSEMFYRTNKDCIVNLKFVQTIQRNDGILLKDNTWVPLAQKKQNDFYIRLSEQLRKM